MQLCLMDLYQNFILEYQGHQVLHHGWATRQSAEPIAPRQWLSFNAQRAKPLHRPTKPRPRQLHDK